MKAFKKLCELLNGYVNKIIVSFLDDYKNVKKKNKKIINEIPFTNYDEEKVKENVLKHDMNSSLLIGKLEADDIVKVAGTYKISIINYGTTNQQLAIEGVDVDVVEPETP